MDDEDFPHGMTHSEWTSAFEQVHHVLGMETPK